MKLVQVGAVGIYFHRDLPCEGSSQPGAMSRRETMLEVDKLRTFDYCDKARAVRMNGLDAEHCGNIMLPAKGDFAAVR